MSPVEYRRKFVLIALLVATACATAPLVSARNTPSQKPPASKDATGAKKGPKKKPGPRPETQRREGFGSQTRGGDDGRVIDVEDPTEDGVRLAFQKANKNGNAIVRFPQDAVIPIVKMLPRITAPYVTIDGNGATLDGIGLEKDVALVDVRTNDVIVRDLRVRNGYDNLRIQGDDAHDVFVTHVSSTGSRDDGISIGYGAHDVTVQWSFLSGNTRSIFCKYGDTTNITLHHLWIQKGWIRSPLLSGHILADIRNVIVEDWGEWGSRFEDGARGNVVASIFSLSPYAHSVGGKGDSALRFVNAGPVYVAKTVFRGEAKPSPTAETEKNVDKPIPAPPVLTHDVDSMEEIVRGGAGCMPRDAVDKKYIALTTGWHVSEEHPILPPGDERAAALNAKRETQRRPARVDDK